MSDLDRVEKDMVLAVVGIRMRAHLRDLIKAMITPGYIEVAKTLYADAYEWKVIYEKLYEAWRG